MHDHSSVESQLSALAARSIDVHSFADLRRKLLSKPSLRIKLGADPSAPDIHLGHAVVLNKLREFQSFGHKVVFIIGDFTGMIGDPSGRSLTRKPLSRQDVERNALTYQKQIFKILDPSLTEVRFNSEWCSSMNFEAVIQLAAKVTVAQLLAREDFAKRYASNQPISLVEFLYPLVQAYDSVMVQADVELGGTDQLFNLLLGRELQKIYGQDPQVVMTMPLLEGLDGVNKMSKSLGNYIGITDEPRTMFGKTMSISDTLMWKYYSLLLAQPTDEMEKAVAAGLAHPRDLKAKLASELVTKFYDAQAAMLAADEFRRVFSGSELPDEIPEYTFDHKTESSVGLLTLLVRCSLAPSNSEARRLVLQGAVRLDDEKMVEPRTMVSIRDGMVLRTGKRGFARVRLIND